MSIKKLATTILIILCIFTIVLPVTITAYADDMNVDYEPRLTAPNSSISYYSRVKNVYFQTGTGMPNCVAYAYGRIYEMNGEKPKITHGSAGDWWFINKNNGYYKYGQTPRLGAVVCWSNHVAVVEKIADNGSITISESHWGGTYFDTKVISNYTSHYGQKFYGFIYTYNGVGNEKEAAVNPRVKKNTVYKKSSYTTADDQNAFSLTNIENASGKKDKTLLKNDPILHSMLIKA